MTNIKNLIDEIERSNEIFNEFIKRAKEQKEILNKIKDNADENIDFLKNFIESNKELSDILINTVLPFFSKRGWYVSIDLYPEQMIKFGKAVGNLNKNAVSSQENSIEEALKCLIRESIYKIEKNVCEAWPTRVTFLKDAFEAHRGAKYTLSIPVLLAQSDGICHEITGQYIFTRHGGGNLQNVLKSKIDESKMTPLKRAFLDMFLKPTSITVQTKIRDDKKANDPFYGPINRHAVLHGDDLNYATEVNSLRCVSLISSLLFLKTVYND